MWLHGTKRRISRPKTLTQREQRQISRFASNSTKFIRKIKAECQLQVSKSTIIGAIHRHTNLKRDKMTSAPKLKTQHKIQRVEFVKNNTSTDWNMVCIFLFSLITCIMCTKPYIFLFLLCRSYLVTKKIKSG